jgi:peptide/nickel transport system substrate-binding protein
MWPEVLLGEYQTFKQAEAKSNANLIKNTQAAHTGLQINMTAKNNPRLRKFIGTKEVRWALSHAINRDEVNQLLYLGMAVPRNYSPIKASPQYYEKATTAHIKYDPTYANQLLDQARYKEKNAQGMRLWPGTQEPISFTVSDHNTAGAAEDALQMTVKYFAAVGITMVVKPVSRVLYDQLNAANDVEAGWWGADRCFMPLASNGIFMGTIGDRCWALAWGKWRNDVAKTDPNAEEPPQDHFIRKIWDIWDKEVIQTSDPAEQTKRFQKILDIWAEEVPMFLVVGDWAIFTYARKGLKNIAAGTVLDWGTNWIGVLPVETFSWEDPATQSVGKRIG